MRYGWFPVMTVSLVNSSQASESLTDKSSEVRTRAVRLVWALGLRYANK